MHTYERTDKASVSWRTLALVGGLVAVLAAGALFVNDKLSAAGEVPVGYVDVGRLIDEYLVPVLDGPLTAETMRLQAEFEEMAAAENLADDERRQLFDDYQVRLNVIKQQMIDEQLPHINEAVARVARREQIDVVLEHQAVLYGGVDLTMSVLSQLRTDAADDT